jgi:hypothetical protein
VKNGAPQRWLDVAERSNAGHARAAERTARSRGSRTTAKRYGV